MTNKLSIFKINDDSFLVEYQNTSEIVDIIAKYSDRKVEILPNQNLVKISGAPKKGDLSDGAIVDADMLDADDVNAGADSSYPQLEVNLFTNYDKIYFGASRKIYGLIELKAPEKEITAVAIRKPLNIVAVLDVSGSMSGQKIECARDSVAKVIENLTENDRFGVVLFDTNIKVLSPLVQMTRQNRDELKFKVLQIQSGSSTNMGGGMQAGFDLFKALPAEIIKTSLNRMILFTDGRANIGLTTSEGFLKLVFDRPEGLSISTFGYGEDHDENLLKSIADNGRGNFYYIKDFNFVLECLASELGGLLTTYAADIKLEIHPSINVAILKVINNLNIEDRNGSAIIDAEDIQLGEKKYIAVRLSVPQVTKAVSMRQFSIIEVKIKYRNNYSNEETLISKKLRIGFVKSENDYVAENEFVREKVIMLHFGVCQKLAMQYADSGDISKAQNEIKKFIAKVEKYIHKYPLNKNLHNLMEQAREVLDKIKDAESYKTRRKEVYMKRVMYEKQRAYSCEDSSVAMFDTSEKLMYKQKWRDEENRRKNENIAPPVQQPNRPADNSRPDAGSSNYRRDKTSFAKKKIGK